MAFADQSFVIVGGAGGIGFEISKQLLKRGVNRLAILDLNDPNDVVKQLCIQFPSETIIFVEVNVRRKNDFAKSVQTVIDQFKYIDGFINAAGIVEEMSADDTIGVNVIGVINGTQIALDHMSISKGGRGGLIVNIASVLGLDYFYTVPIYCASKHAVVAYTRSMADEKFESIFGVKFVTICPGFTKTSLIEQIRGLYIDDLTEVHANFIAKRGLQTAEECGRALVDALEKSVNGSIWIIDNNTYKPVTLKIYWNID